MAVARQALRSGTSAPCQGMGAAVSASCKPRGPVKSPVQAGEAAGRTDGHRGMSEAGPGRGREVVRVRWFPGTCYVLGRTLGNGAWGWGRVLARFSSARASPCRPELPTPISAWASSFQHLPQTPGRSVSIFQTLETFYSVLRLFLFSQAPSVLVHEKPSSRAWLASVNVRNSCAFSF